MELPFFVKADSSDYAMGAVLLQQHEEEKLYPAAFYSRKFSASEINYEVHDKELLAVVSAFRIWRRFLEGARHEVTVFTDHKNLMYFTTSKVLNRRQARWSMFLYGFEFKLVYRPGTKQCLSDALSRRSDYSILPEDEAFINQKATILKRTVDEVNQVGIRCTVDKSILLQIIQATKSDHWFLGIKDKIVTGNLEPFKYEDGIVYYKNLLYVPSEKLRLKIMTMHHDTPVAGHAGIQKTLELITRNYCWPKIGNYIKKYVQSCDICAMAKASRHKRNGKLMPIPIPNQPWKSISLDFITDLPLSSGFDCILVVVDRFTKMAHFEPCTKSITAKGCVNILLRTVFKLHGIPDEIISDRGPQFVSKFWNSLLNALGTKAKLSSAFHPETDGQTERVNQILEQYLRCTVNYEQNNWKEILPLAEICYNNWKHASAGISSFYANFGYHPKFDFTGKEESCPATSHYLDQICSSHSLMQMNIARAQDRYKKYVNKKRCDAPSFNEGDKVWLLKTNIKTERPRHKLDYMKVGPFQIKEMINKNTFRLNLPPTWKIHVT